jgi:hypothetical protein
MGKLRAVEDQSAPSPEEITSELGRIIFISRSFGLGCANSRGPLVFTSLFGSVGRDVE